MRVLTFSLLLLVTAVASPQDRIERARQKMADARVNLDSAEKALIKAYTVLELEYEKISGPNCPDFLRTLSDVWAGQEKEIKKIWGNLSRLGRRISERRFEEEIHDLLLDKASDITRVPPQLIVPFLRLATATAYDAMRHSAPFGKTEILPELQKILTIRTPFYAFWNESLLADIEEAKVFAEANDRFAEAKHSVDRILHPHRYDSRGRRSPPGMIVVEGGNYTLGPNTGWEKKRRKVRIAEMFIDKYEVTNKEFNIFLRTLDEDLRRKYLPYFWPADSRGRRYYPDKRADHPVIGVSWEAADAYARWKEKRLPTEDEWEVAATGGDGRLYPWGDRFDVHACNSRESARGATAEVGSFSSGVSPFGCYDMAGNAAEWTSTDQDGKTVVFTEGAILNVAIRGGSYLTDASRASCRYRWMTPINPYEGSRPSAKAIGFRCARDAR